MEGSHAHDSFIPARSENDLRGCRRAPSSFDAKWHFAEATHRTVVRVWAPTGSGPLARPVRVAVRSETLPVRAQSLRAWDLTTHREVAVQVQEDGWFLDVGEPITQQREHHCLVYLTPGPSTGMRVARIEGGRVETDRYIVRVDGRRGGVLSSLLLKEADKRTEILGDGLRWWMGRSPQITQESFAGVTCQRTADGSVFAALRFTFSDVLAAGNSFSLDYRFFRDFIEADYHYATTRPARLQWLKIPVPCGQRGRSRACSAIAARRMSPC